MDDSSALSGITVIDLSRLLPGPYCSMVLADHGARVIAVEDRRFQDDDFFISAVMRNKQHMTLNLKIEEGRQIFYRLVQIADVVIEGFRPGVVERLRSGRAAPLYRAPLRAAGARGAQGGGGGRLSKGCLGMGRLGMGRLGMGRLGMGR